MIFNVGSETSLVFAIAGSRQEPCWPLSNFRIGDRSRRTQVFGRRQGSLNTSAKVDQSLQATCAFMRTQLISCRLPKADSALLRSSLFHHLCRFVSSSSGERRRGSPFAEASDPGGSRNGSTEMRS
jgi:hypothetical protein